MNSFSRLALPALLLSPSATLIEAQQSTSCGTGGFSVAGSSTVRPIAQKWAEEYSDLCAASLGTPITVQGGGSSHGASRVCDTNDSLSAVDIGNMSRQWRLLEATTVNGYMYSCNDSDREIIQIDVAIDGLTLAVKRGGTASKCLATLPGLTLEQVRWMYSGYNDAALAASATPWSPSSIPFLNDNEADHLWSELSNSPECPPTEIKISGADDQSGTHEYFLEATGFDLDGGEYFDATRPGDGYVNSPEDEVIVQYLQDNEDAIGYFGYSYFYQNQAGLEAIAIQNSQDAFIAPDPSTIEDGSYNPYSRRIYMNLLDEPAVLERTVPFIEFGMSNEGVTIVSTETGYVPIPEWERVLMLSYINGMGGIDLSTVTCGPPGGFSVAGSSTVFPVVQIWAGLVGAACPLSSIFVKGGGSSEGARRVCNEGSDAGNPVEIGNMSRQWRDSEATTTNGWRYQCVHGVTSRSVIQLDVAIDGLSVATKSSGRAQACINRLGGLTLDQLRWIFSSYTIDELTSSGWDPSSVANLDTSSSTRMWSELDAECAETAILISGADSESGTYEYFSEAIFEGVDNDANPETFDGGRIGGYFNSDVDEDIVEHLITKDAAIGYFGFAYVFRNSNQLYAAPIQNSEGDFITPAPDVIEDGTYNPLARRIYSNALEDDALLPLLRPFFDFAFSSAGTLAMERASGYSSIPEWEKYVMLSRIGADSGVDASEVDCGPANGEITIAGSSTVFPVAQLWAGIYDLYCDVRITVEGGGSTVGASRVCADGVRQGSPVDIGDMSREWKDEEAIATAADSINYNCAGSTRSVIQVQVAIDGLTVVAQLDAAGSECLAAMGGLTKDQLRWIYSSYSRAQLANTGWDESSIPGSDNNDGTHLWSELSTNAVCPSIEIRIAGADVLSGTYEYFLETVLTDYENGETFDNSRSTGYFNSDRDEALVNYVNTYADAIAYFGYAYYFANQENLFAAPIRNPSTLQYVEPNETTVGNGDYSPLARPIYMNLWDDPATLQDTKPFIEFGFSNAGDSLVGTTGYVKALETTQGEALTAIEIAASKFVGNPPTPGPTPLPGQPSSPTTPTRPSAPTTSTSGGGDDGGSSRNMGAIVGGAVAGVIAVILFGLVICLTRRNRDEGFDTSVFTNGEAVVTPDASSPIADGTPVV